ncbi:MAG: phosphotransferase family protein [Robiginitomaculum sp.]|nr:MAG: phosphotransferase family protein [Robiginitomaculum sp.]
MSGENATIEVRSGEELDAKRIGQFLDGKVTGAVGTPKIRQFPSGASNLTYLLQYPDVSLVLRRPPSGSKPKSGHDMGREYRIMQALNGHFPVPACLLFSEDEDVVGAPFYVMERVEGLLIKSEFPPELGWDKSDAAKLCTTFFDLLVALHKLDIDQVGLSDFGKADGYVTRQITGWDRRYERAQTPDVDAFEDVRKWLLDNIPAETGRASILHGDFRIDNMILDRKNPFQINAVLDWEISALGDPLMDLGNTLAYWTEANDPEPMKMLAKQPSWAPGMFTRQQALEHYASKTGIDPSGFVFYYTYGLWRLAVIIQQIYFRFYQGQTKNAAFADFAAGVNGLGNYCRQVIERDRI